LVFRLLAAPFSWPSNLISYYVDNFTSSFFFFFFLP
jgi:hypothetical protein